MHPLKPSFACILCVHPLLPWVAKGRPKRAEHRTYHAEHRKVFIGVGVGVGAGVGAKGHGHRHRHVAEHRKVFINSLCCASKALASALHLLEGFKKRVPTHKTCFARHLLRKACAVHRVTIKCDIFASLLLACFFVTLATSKFKFALGLVR